MTTTPDRHAWARRRHLLRAAIGETLALDLEALTTSLLAAVELALEDEPHTPAAPAERPQDAPGGERGTEEAREAPRGAETATQTLQCPHAHLQQPHAPHHWEPQPGMTPVHCPGHPPTDSPHLLPGADRLAASAANPEWGRGAQWALDRVCCHTEQAEETPSGPQESAEELRDRIDAALWEFLAGPYDAALRHRATEAVMAVVQAAMGAMPVYTYDGPCYCDTRHRAETAEATLDRVRELAERWRYTPDRKGGPLRALRSALDGPDAPTP